LHLLVECKLQQKRQPYFSAKKNSLDGVDGEFCKPEIGVDFCGTDGFILYFLS
jgi:hypothetical protein